MYIEKDLRNLIKKKKQGKKCFKLWKGRITFQDLRKWQDVKKKKNIERKHYSEEKNSNKK
jgi:hypothetical protein